MTDTDDQSITPLPLHLHTLDSLLRELASGRPITLGKEDADFRLKDKETQAILDWFIEDRSRWVGQVRSDDDVWDIVRAGKSEPTVYPPITIGGKGTARPTYRVKSVRAHHFAGLHEYGTTKDVEYDLATGVTLFEGKNGSGKTSLLNTLIWCLTGKILRAQQWPQTGFTAVDLKAGEGDNEVTARSVAVSPTPPDTIVKANANKNVPIDTWVEVVLTGSDGKDLPPLKRRIYTDDRSRLKQEEPDFSGLTLPPTAFETGTSMPGMLPMIRVGETSDIGKAIAELTGFNDLRNLADRARRLRDRMTGKMTKNIESKIEGLHADFSNTWLDLVKRMGNNAALMPKPAKDYPFLKKKLATENDLLKLREHFENLEGQAFEKAKDILGPSFDPTDSSLRNELQQYAGQALGLTDFATIYRLESASRLGRLKDLKDEEHAKAGILIASLFNEYEELAELAAKPDLAARERLYARVASWMHESDEGRRHLENCALCNSGLEGKADIVTGLPVRDHLQKRLDKPSKILAHTLDAWRDHAEKRLSHELPETLRGEMNSDLPNTPSDLMIQALTKELFVHGPFQGSLASLKAKVETLCDGNFATLPAFKEPEPLTFPSGFEDRFADLSAKLNHLHRALAFIRWYKENVTTWDQAVRKIIGPVTTVEGVSDTTSLSGLLAALETIVSNAEPIKFCLKNVDDLLLTLKSIAEREGKIKDLAFTAEKIEILLTLGDLVDSQMEMLRVELHQETTLWKDRLYLRPSGTAPRHAETHVSSEGSLDFSSEIRGTRVPSQHVSNSSDMRATLFAFLIAFWQHVRDTHGGLDLLVFDDPQEMFDWENQRNLSKALTKLGEDGAQLLISSFDPRFTDVFASEIGRAEDVKFVHRRISPITDGRPFVAHALMERDLERKRKAFLSPNVGEEDSAAKDYVIELRTYIENHLSECFPERIPGMSPDDTIGPYLGHIRRLANNGHMPFATPPFQNLIDNQVFADNSDVLSILNRAVHKYADTITRNEVKKYDDDLLCAKSLVDNAHMAFELHRMGASSHVSGKRPTLTVAEPTPLEPPVLKIDIILDLAAFTGVTIETDPQTAETPLTHDVFKDKALYHLNTNNFGFAAQRESIAIVDVEPAPVENGRLVLTRYGDKILAGRLLRDPNRPGLIALGSEAENPLERPPSHFLPEDAVALHKVTGILFFNDPPPDLRRRAIGDAAPINTFPPLAIEVAFKVRDDSAIPLALPGQILLGGKALTTEDLKNGEGLLVAVATSDGQQVFKRVGKPLFSGREDIRQFESIGGKGDSLALALEEEVAIDELPYVTSARLILGVLYTA